MGNDITAGYTWADTTIGKQVTVSNLNSAIADATLKETAISGRTLRDYSALSASDKVLVSDGTTLKYTTVDDIRKWERSNNTGATLQILQTSQAAYDSTATIIPMDDTIPTSTEGKLAMTQAITPSANTNKILVEVDFNISAGGSTYGIVSLLRDGTCIVARAVNTGGADILHSLSFSILDAPATTSAVSYTVRFGPSNATTAYTNGLSYARFLGGISANHLTVTEIKA